MDRLNAWAPRVLSVLRIVAGLLYMQHGAMKILHFPEGMPGGEALPPLIMLAGWMELVGGGLLALGLFTRPVAFLLSGQMAVAYFMAHASQGFYPIMNKGELAVLYCFVFFYFVFAGAGPWSLDAVVRKRT
ncbi:MAG TPA: DoxX family protein [Caulobacteraceae bacterium]